MKISVDEKLFLKLAKDLKTTPENIIKIFLEHASNLPHSVWIDAIQENSSLDKALDKLMTNSEVAFTIGSLIEEIVGDHEYIIDDGSYDIEKGIINFNIIFLEGGNESMNEILLQFGSDSGELISASMNDLVLDKDVGEFLDEIYYVLDELDDEYEFDFEWLDNKYLTFTIQIDTSEILNLPKVDDLDKIVKKIKEIIKSHNSRRKLT